MSKSLTSIVLWFLLFVPIVNSKSHAETIKIVPAESVNWGYLNPLRGDKSPGAGELWGDRTKDLATGMLVKFNHGFSSPPHIHNITYRGIVIEGELHNDDPGAEQMWMPTGSFWTQPAGESHVTAAAGETNLIYLEIDSGPYLVKPSKEKFDNGERPLNLHINNMVWQSLFGASDGLAKQAHISHLWGSTEPAEVGGVLLKLSSGFNAKLFADGNELKAVIIKGEVKIQIDEKAQPKILSKGSFFEFKGSTQLELVITKDALLYLRSDNQYKFIAK